MTFDDSAMRAAATHGTYSDLARARVVLDVLADRGTTLRYRRGFVPAGSRWTVSDRESGTERHLSDADVYRLIVEVGTALILSGAAPETYRPFHSDRPTRATVRALRDLTTTREEPRA